MMLDVDQSGREPATYRKLVNGEEDNMSVRIWCVMRKRYVGRRLLMVLVCGGNAEGMV